MTYAEIRYFIFGFVVVSALITMAVKAHGQSGWVDQLQNQNKNVCCYDNDGRRLDDPEWRTSDDSYEVLFTEGWVRVPAEAIVTMTNRDGIARVWSFPGANGRSVRCFLPGAFG